ncbi:MAG TPA: TetR/AcrR family transcriptional regulator [Bdellovibrionales bacterium]|nr:TetR/AcrR family transcriptional regulator [Bdellovibrionales bacterium]
MSAKVKGPKTEISSEELKAKLVQVARKHFAMHGLNGASLKDIAGEADVANSLINYHFKDKEGLFRASIEPFARMRMEAISRLLNEARNLEEFRLRIELFVEEMQNAVLEDQHSFEIIDRELRAENEIVVKIFQDTMLNAFKHVVQFFMQAQKDGLVRGDLDPMILSSILFTSTCDAVRKEFLAKRFFNISFRDVEWRRKFAHHIAALFIKGVIK